MSSKSATVLVIFIIAIVAFCLASVFAAMTGPISILPNETESEGGILDNLSAITEDTGNTGNSYGSQNYDDYSSNDDSSSDNSQVETTTDTSSSKTTSSDSSVQDSTNKEKPSSNQDDSGSSKSESENVVTTTDN